MSNFERTYESEDLIIYNFRCNGFTQEFILQKTLHAFWIGRCCGETIIKGTDKESIINSCEEWMKENSK